MLLVDRMKLRLTKDTYVYSINNIMYNVMYNIATHSPNTQEL